MIIVSNTSPLSNLAKIGQLNLIQQLYQNILIPQAVYQELTDERAGETVINAIKLANWIEIQEIKDQVFVQNLQNSVNLGEAEAITLAVEVKATKLLIDERLGRQVASNLGLNIIGILGCLVKAKNEGLITSVKPMIDDLINVANFRVSQQLYQTVLTSVNESHS